jgi:hypothetical protein
MYRKSLGTIAGLALLAVSSGCALTQKNPHNDVLVFATVTKLGVDLSAPLNSATLPQINIGYNRAEAVWMPLRPNGPKGSTPAELRTATELSTQLQSCEDRLKDVIADQQKRKLTCLATVLPSDKYVSMSSGIQSDRGGSGIEIDTYSVFASFGVRGSASGSQGSGGLAQVFATGIAAQRLAANPQVGQALNSAAPTAVVAAEKADEAKEKTKQMRLENARMRIAPLQEEEADLIKRIDSEWSCGDLAKPADKSKFDAAVDDADTASASAIFGKPLKLLTSKQAVIDSLNNETASEQRQFLTSMKAKCV